MRWRRFRVRLWMLSVLVLATGIALGALAEWKRLRRRAMEFDALSKRFEKDEQAWIMIERTALTFAERTEQQLSGSRKLSVIESIFMRDAMARQQDLERRQNEHVQSLRLHAARCRSKADYYATLKRKYRRAADHPWQTVPPDPPEPK